MSEFQAWKGSTIFCEDVRHELHGKMTLVGVYQNFIGIRQDDLHLPKLVAVNFVERPGVRAGESVHLEVRNGDSVMFNASIPAPPEWDECHPGFENAPAAFISIPVEMVPFTAKAGGEIQVVLRAANKEYRSPKLAIFKGTPPA